MLFLTFQDYLVNRRVAREIYRKDGLWPVVQEHLDGSQIRILDCTTQQLVYLVNA